MAGLSVALCSCAHWEFGWFSAYRHMAERTDLDIVMCVGDYFYEYGPGEFPLVKGPTVRRHAPEHETVSLDDYRTRYGQYRTDPDLQAAHAAHPWVVTWDDHEIANDASRDGAQNHDAGEGDFHARRDAAMRAYLEWMPVRLARDAGAPGPGHLYRTLDWGSLASICMLDLRSYRDEKLSYLRIRDTDDDGRTMLGSDQFQYLRNTWENSTARWNVVGNSVMFTPVLLPALDERMTGAFTRATGIVPRQGLPWNLDQWDGYAAERRRVTDVIGELRSRPAGPGGGSFGDVVFMTGDIHSSWSCNVPARTGDWPGSGTAATEVVCTSVTSPTWPEMAHVPESTGLHDVAEAAFRALNPHLEWVEVTRHGYASVDFGREGYTAEWLLADDVLDPATPYRVAHRARWVDGSLRPA